MKTIHVVAAVIFRTNAEGVQQILATQRGYGEFKGGWEFPGGKIEEGETPEAALKREIQEELTVDISVGSLIDTVEYDYPNFHLTMECFRCTIASGELQLTEHSGALWLDKETRVGLALRFASEKGMGLTETTLWLNGMQFPFKLTVAEQILGTIEVYASMCYDNTQKHLAEIQKLSSVEELVKYNYKAGYPDKLNLSM